MRSSLPLASHFPSGENATVYTTCSWRSSWPRAGGTVTIARSARERQAHRSTGHPHAERARFDIRPTTWPAAGIPRYFALPGAGRGRRPGRRGPARTRRPAASGPVAHPASGRSRPSDPPQRDHVEADNRLFGIIAVKITEKTHIVAALR